MQESFELPVIYNGKELLYPAQLQQLGYTHRIVVDVDGIEVSFEPDEERNYRGIVDPESPAGNFALIFCRPLLKQLRAS